MLGQTVPGGEIGDNGDNGDHGDHHGDWDPPGDHHDRETGVGVKGNRKSDEALGVAVAKKKMETSLMELE